VKVPLMPTKHSTLIILSSS